MEIPAKSKSELIRLGNLAFQNGDYNQARQLFLKADYKDGLLRLGDYYMFERRLPLLAYGYYKKAGASDRIADLQRRMVGALGEWIGKDKIRPESVSNLGIPLHTTNITVHPLLRETALKILEKNKTT